MRFSDYILSAKVQWLQHGFHKYGSNVATPAALRAKSHSESLDVPTLH
jgi:hypothetical protein